MREDLNMNLVPPQQKVVNFAEASQLCQLVHHRQRGPDKRFVDKAIKRLPRFSMSLIGIVTSSK